MGNGDGPYDVRYGSNFFQSYLCVAASCTLLAGDSNATAGGGEDAILGSGKPKVKETRRTKQASNGTKANDSTGAKTKKGKGSGKITGTSSSLLGDIIAELDDLLDGDFFTVASTNSTEVYSEKGLLRNH